MEKTHLQYLIYRCIMAILLLQLNFGQTSSFEPMAPVQNKLDSGLTAADIELLLDLHNMYRRDEYEANNMAKLIWSEALEQEAAKWVKGCQFKHQESPPWGENLFRTTASSSVDIVIERGLGAWQLEYYNIYDPYVEVDCCDTEKKTCCHYSQLMWAESVYLGCAVKRCDSLQGETTKTTYQNGDFMACYYYPPGNVLTQQPFSKGGGTCSNCTEWLTVCDKGLCAFDPVLCKPK